jgi:hypothetical protein
LSAQTIPLVPETADPGGKVHSARSADQPAGLSAYQEVAIFYQESERLVRLLDATDASAFRGCSTRSRGESFDTALSRPYSGRFFDVDALEKEFLPYASQDAKSVAASR